MKPIVTQDSDLTFAEVHRLALLVDAEVYYRAFVQAAKLARRSILLSGWQFDTQAELLRGQNVDPEFSPRFLPFLNQLLERNSELEIHVLAWDYSVVYAVEREWLQGLKAAFRGHPRLQFSYWTHPNPGGSHHHKYAVIDDQIAFVGGLDICDSRWDDRRHLARRPERLDVSGKPYKPFHDLQLSLTGPAVGNIRRIFSRYYQDVHGRPFVDPPFEPVDPEPFERLVAMGLPIPVDRIVLSRTVCAGDVSVAADIEELFVAAIAAAERFIYVENQYFTSRAILSALMERLSDPERSRLDVLFVMPNGADSAKEDLVLGDRQRAVRYALSKLAGETGHRLRFLYSAEPSDEEAPVSTFIHSKLLLVDDEFMSVGSANLTNRSMRVDSELNASVGGTQEVSDELRAALAALRASLLAEHAGCEDAQLFLDSTTLLETVDRFVAEPYSKLWYMHIEQPDEQDPFLLALFDPSGEVSFDSLSDALQEEVGQDTGLFKKLIQKAGQRLGVVDID